MSQEVSRLKPYTFICRDMVRHVGGYVCMGMELGGTVVVIIGREVEGEKGPDDETPYMLH